MNRKERRALFSEAKREQHSFIKKQQLPAMLTRIPEDEFPSHLPGSKTPVKAWRSNRYMVQMYEEGNRYFPVLIRLSICRVRLNSEGRWKDGLTWDELQAIKSEIGFGEWYGVEVFPADKDVVNVANFRHLWLLPSPLPIGF